MNEEGQCKECGAFYDRNTYPICPRCRAASVAKAYMPRDPERTAKAINIDMHDVEERTLSEMFREQRAVMSYFRGRICEPYPHEEVYDSFPGLPLGEAAQVYELRRMFRL